MDPFSIIAAVIGLASAVGGVVTSVKNRKTAKENTLELFDLETERNRENWQMQNDYNRNQLNRTIRDAQQSGINPLSVLGSPSYSAGAIDSASPSAYPSADTSLLTSILPFASSLMSQTLESKKVDKDNEVKNAEIDKIFAETEAIRNKNRDYDAKNQALQKSFSAKGIEIPRLGATGFVDGLERADEVITNQSDRILKRVMNNNMMIVEQFKSQPEYLEKMQASMYAELDRNVVALEDAKEILKGHKLDNKKNYQEIEINKVRYQVVKTDLAKELFNLNVIQPKQAQSLDLSNSNARADFENKFMQQEFMLFKVQTEREKHNWEQQSNPYYWSKQADEAMEKGDQIYAGRCLFNSLFYMIPHYISTAIGIKNIGKD